MVEKGKEPAAPRRDYLAEIIVKFREAGNWLEQTPSGLVPATDEIVFAGVEGWREAPEQKEDWEEEGEFSPFFRLLRSREDAVGYRSFRGPTPYLQASWEQAREYWGYEPPKLEYFVRVRLKEKMDEAQLEELVYEYRELPNVEYAVLSALPGPPPQDRTSEQGYLYSKDSAAPDPRVGGVNAKWAWEQEITGAGVQVFDYEYGFDGNHVDLPVIPSFLGGPITADVDHKAHGTKVLSVLGAPDLNEGMTGICYGSDLFFASASGAMTPILNGLVAHAAANHAENLLAAGFPLPGGGFAPLVQVGDVVLMEVQTLQGLLPAEQDPDVHASVKHLVGDGVVVVAAAGNGDKDLGQNTDLVGRDIWAASDGGPLDSGAILVGAGYADPPPLPLFKPHARVSASNYGQRVDCQGWGSGVLAAVPDPISTSEYVADFDQTSSAAAIVAGVSACLQQAAKDVLGAPLTAREMRDMLRDKNRGTPQYPDDSSQEHIGPLPDLKLLIESLA